MTLQEFSNEFDILYNNIMSNQAPGLDEYEKSVFLTQAQENIILAYYKGNGNLGYFEGDEQVRTALRSILMTDIFPNKYLEEDYTPIKYYNMFSQSFDLPDDVWFIVQESVGEGKGTWDIPVIPITYDEFHKIKRNPFRTANHNRVLRLDGGQDRNQVTLISEYDLSNIDNPYMISYIQYPSPIILTDLEEGLTINNKHNSMGCMLDPSIHRLILTQAVQLAAAAYKS